MTKWLTRTTLALLLMCVTPVTASAQFWDIVKWINDMSGPQMTGFVYEQTVWCRYENGDQSVFLGCTPFKFENGQRSVHHRNLTAGLRVGRTWNTKTLAGDTETRDISMFLIGPSVRWTPSKAPYLDVSAGFEMVRFYGPTVEAFWVPTTDIGVTFKPFAIRDKFGSFGHFYSLAVSHKQFMETFGGERFGAPNSFESQTEGIWQFTFARLDFSALIFR